MDKNRALEIFLQKEVKTAERTFLIHAMNRMRKEEKAVYQERFIKDVKTLLEQCLCESKKEGKKLRFLQISMLRANLLSGIPFYLLEGFGREFYLSEPIGTWEPDFSWLYQEFWNFCKEIKIQSQRYIMKIDDLDLDQIKLAQVFVCNRIILHLLKESLFSILSLDEFGELISNNHIQIQIGEYRGPFEVVLEADENIRKIGRWWNGLL